MFSSLILNGNEGVAGVASIANCIPGPYHHHQPYSLEMRQVNNGFIVKHHGSEYVFANIEDMTVWLAKQYKERNK